MLQPHLCASTLIFLFFILQSEGPETVAFWNVSYPAHTYAPGPYEVEVIVDRYVVVYWPISSQRINFNITGNELNINN
jgi:hypothetical protein